MKVDINDDGELEITPQSRYEVIALRDWLQRHAGEFSGRLTETVYPARNYLDNETYQIQEGLRIHLEEE